MTRMERLTREVERDLQRWCDEPLNGTSQDDDVIPADSYGTASLHQATTTESAECGVRYQRCGGGRRVIRKGRSE